MGHLGQRQRQRRPGRSPELLRHLLSGRIGQELRRPPQRQAREACRPAAHHLRSGRACEDRRRDAAAAAGRQLLRLLLLPAHEHDHEGQRLRSRSTHLRLLRADRESRYPVSKRKRGGSIRPSVPRTDMGSARKVSVLSRCPFFRQHPNEVVLWQYYWTISMWRSPSTWIPSSMT